jgi:hypothetical protein
MTELDKLPEPPPKWLCKECGEFCAAPLTAPSPFDPSDTLHACPSCLTVGELAKACDYPGCCKAASVGQPNWLGFRYASTCSEHSEWRDVKAKAHL